VVVHTRGGSVEDALRLVAEQRAVRAVFHCWVHEWAVAQPIVDAGHLISFTGIATYPKAPEVISCAMAAPAGSFMLETDSRTGGNRVSPPSYGTRRSVSPSDVARRWTNSRLIPKPPRPSFSAGKTRTTPAARSPALGHNWPRIRRFGAGQFLAPIVMIRLISSRRARVVASLAVCALGLTSALAENPYIGRWALSLPGGGAGWLGVEEAGTGLKGSILWAGGSVLPLESVVSDGKTLTLTRKHIVKRQDTAGKDIKEVVIETITAETTGEALKLTTEKTAIDGKKSGRAEFTGKRIAALPPAPDLSKVTFGPAITLFNGKDLAGWKLIDPKADNGWSVVDGNLINRIEKGKHHGNLRTEQEFEDFSLTLELRTQAKSNSGIYLRGIYEVQVAETFGKALDPHNMGALYSRITPSVAAEKPIGEWQTLAITLVERHLTVVLNGQTIIANQPVLGCTGGALSSDETKPGPLYLQGDHTNIDFRNLVLRPVVKAAK
jgi:Domain of Unknown Function (DUF1080)/TatD related DNase